MTWVKIDDQFYDHPKSVKAGRDGRDLFIAGLCYCAAQLSDGFIDAEIVPLIAFKAGVTNPKKTAELLVSVGFWDCVDGGFQVHGYLEYNPSGAKVKEERAAAKERMDRLRSGNRLRESQPKKPSCSEVVRPNKTRTSESVRSHPYPYPSHIADSPQTPTENTEDLPGYENALAADLEGFDDFDPRPAATQKQHSRHSRNQTQAQSASAEGREVCGAARPARPAKPADTRQTEIDAFLAEHPWCADELSRRGDTATRSRVGLEYSVMGAWRDGTEEMPEKPKPAPVRMTAEQLADQKRRADQEADARFWRENEILTGKTKEETLASLPPVEEFARNFKSMLGNSGNPGTPGKSSALRNLVSRISN